MKPWSSHVEFVTDPSRKPPPPPSMILSPSLVPSLKPSCPRNPSKTGLFRAGKIPGTNAELSHWSCYYELPLGITSLQFVRICIYIYVYIQFKNIYIYINRQVQVAMICTLTRHASLLLQTSPYPRSARPGSPDRGEDWNPKMSEGRLLFYKVSWFFIYNCLGCPPPRMPVANEGLGWDPRA